MTSVAVWLGTLILYVPTPHGGGFVSADSRYDAGEPARRDEAQKIFLCGRAAVCAVSGGLRLDVTTDEGNAGTLDISALLERTSTAMRANEDQTPEALLASLRSAMYAGMLGFWDKFLAGRRVAAPMSMRLGAPSVCTILFVAPGSVAQVQFPLIERRGSDGLWTHDLREPMTRDADPLRPLAQGHTECVSPSEKLPANPNELEALYAPARETESCRDVIGGAVDIAVIEDGVARWLQRKGPKPLATGGNPTIQ